MNQAVADDYTVTHHVYLKPLTGLGYAYELVNASGRIVLYCLPCSLSTKSWRRGSILPYLHFTLYPGIAHAQAAKGFVSQL
jgi:hypothetical protein